MDARPDRSARTSRITRRTPPDTLSRGRSSKLSIGIYRRRCGYFDRVGFRFGHLHATLQSRMVLGFFLVCCRILIGRLQTEQFYTPKKRAVERGREATRVPPTPELDGAMLVIGRSRERASGASPVPALAVDSFFNTKRAGEGSGSSRLRRLCRLRTGLRTGLRFRFLTGRRCQLLEEGFSGLVFGHSSLRGEIFCL